MKIKWSNQNIFHIGAMRSLGHMRPRVRCVQGDTRTLYRDYQARAFCDFASTLRGFWAQITRASYNFTAGHTFSCLFVKFGAEKYQKKAIFSFSQVLLV